MEVGQLLGKLKPFENKTVLVNQFQDSNDIIKEILKAHTKYSNEYDKISNYFWKGSVKKTCKAIFEYLKKNVDYDIEPDTKQTVKSPSAIIAQGYGDCKHYSLFIAGILDSLRRKGHKINWSYRFANYKMFSRTPHHVFCVVDPHTKRELWIDPVLEFFDNKKPYINAVDKNYKQMALYSISGVIQSRLYDKNRIHNIVAKIKSYKKLGYNLKTSPYYRNYYNLVKRYNFLVKQYRSRTKKITGFNRDFSLQSVAGIGCCDGVGYTAAQKQQDIKNLLTRIREFKRNNWDEKKSPYWTEWILLRKEYNRVKELPTMNGIGFTGTTSIEGIGRRSRAERRARRAARREARRSGPNCKGRTAAKITLSPARRAFLLLVRLNVRGLGVKIYKGLQDPEIAPKIYSKWCGLGGKAALLRSTAEKAYQKAKSRGKVSGIGVAIETTLAIASVVIAAMDPILKLVKGGGDEQTEQTEQTAAE